jgi:hypothetical protein
VSALVIALYRLVDIQLKICHFSYLQYIIFLLLCIVINGTGH